MTYTDQEKMCIRDRLLAIPVYEIAHLSQNIPVPLCCFAVAPLTGSVD